MVGTHQAWLDDDTEGAKDLEHAPKTNIEGAQLAGFPRGQIRVRVHVYQMKVAARVGDTHGEEEPSLPLPMPGPPSLYHISLCAGARFARCGSNSTGKETPRGRGRGLQRGALNVQRENLSGLEGHAADKNSAAPGRPRATSPLRHRAHQRQGGLERGPRGLERCKAIVAWPYEISLAGRTSVLKANIKLARMRLCAMSPTAWRRVCFL
jgi:hypothetical protein